MWHTSPFVADDDLLLGRPVLGGRPAAWLALEDKVGADALWAAAGVDHAPHRVCDLDRTALAAATRELSTTAGRRVER